jgi:diguanylate cyclase (GGDEF)-like protein/PAS domain S-box-containing protein
MSAIQGLRAWQLWLLMVTLSIAMSELISAAMGWLLLGHVPADYLLTGLAASLLVASLVVAIVLYASEEIKVAARRLQIALEGTRTSVWESDLRTDQIWIDASWAAILGMSPGETRTNAADLLKLVHPDDRQGLIAAAVRAQKGEIDRYIAEYRVRNVSGEWKWVLSNGRVIERDAAGLPLRISGTSTDITERKRAEEALQKSEEKFRKAFDLNPDAANINRIDDGRYVAINRSFTQVTGYTEDEIIGHPTIALDIWDDPEDRARLAHGLQKDGAVLNLEARFRAKDGGIRYGLVSSSVIEIDNVPHFLSITRDITERKHMEEEVRQLAFHDALTKLPNRRLLDDRLSHAMAASKRSGCHGALMFLDLDNFKSLNDTHGHGIGDLLLIEAASRLKHCVREVDTVARFGGDEFVVIISELDADRSESVAQADNIAQKIRAALAKPNVLTVQGEGGAQTTIEYRYTASIGVALFGRHDNSLEDILKWADAAMYQAKQAGSNLIQFYAPKA